MAEKKGTQRTNMEAFDNACKVLGKNPTDLARDIGYHGNNVTHWRTNGLPKVAALACEALVRRQGNSLRETLLLIATNEIDKVAAIKTVAKSLGLEVKVIRE